MVVFGGWRSRRGNADAAGHPEVNDQPAGLALCDTFKEQVLAAPSDRDQAAIPDLFRELWIQRPTEALGPTYRIGNGAVDNFRFDESAGHFNFG